MKKNLTPIILISAILLVTIIVAYFFSSVKINEGVKKINLNKQTLDGCLEENLNIFYKFEKKERPLANVAVRIIDKNTAEEKQSFNIDNIFENYHPIELHKCGIYVIKFFNYNSKFSKQKPEFSADFWKYDYNGEGVKLLASGDFSYVFRVSPPEKHIALIRGYSGRDDYALIIKDLKTLKDAFVLPVADMVKQNPDVVGDISFENGGWSLDGKYFWFAMSQTSDIVGFVRVDSSNWSYQVFPTPQRTMGGDAFNINTGMVTYGEDVAPWSGVVEIDAEIQKEAIKRGQISSFYIYNLFTKKKYLVATTTDPTYYFRPEWLSDTELQYEMPSGNKKVYKIN